MPVPQPIWVTPAGEIGTFVEEIPVIYNFSANPGTLGNTLQYTVLNGEFPPGSTSLTEFQLSTLGVLSGTPAQVNGNIPYTFTVRLNEYNGPTLVSFIDRTFSIIVTGSTAPTFVTPSGPLYAYDLLDSVWDPVQVVISNPDPDTTAIVRLISGILPPGLEINSSGLIRGYAGPPLTVFGSPTITTYAFILEVASESGSNTSNFSITVKNQDVTPTTRYPVITNTRPPNFIPLPTDPYAPYYLASSGNIGAVYHDNYFIFKVIGVDFYDEPLIYTLTSGALPPGLTLNTSTGWITGIVGTPPGDPIVQTYTFTITATSTVSTLISNSTTFVLPVVKSIDNVPVDITVNWITPDFLGTIDNGAISIYSVLAENPSGLELQYTLASGSLPPNLTLLSSGEISGRVLFESGAGILPQGSTVSYQFTIVATNTTYPEITATKVFTIDLYQKFSIPYENLYITAYMNPLDRAKLLDLVEDPVIFPPEVVYRPGDPYFGISQSVFFQQMYGVPSSSVTTYISSVYENYYWRNLLLGPVKTALAKNIDGEIVYEVVYSPILDYLETSNGQSISKVVQWPRPIAGYTNTVYPNSLYNMREQISDNIPGLITDPSILPLWMSCQQNDGNTIGFIPAWVICYTKPGHSSTVQNNINTLWATKLNQLSFIIDRFEVDKSFTYNYSGGSWLTTPSLGVNNDSQDKYIFFPKKNILN